MLNGGCVVVLALLGVDLVFGLAKHASKKKKRICKWIIKRIEFGGVFEEVASKNRKVAFKAKIWVKFLSVGGALMRVYPFYD